MKILFLLVSSSLLDFSTSKKALKFGTKASDYILINPDMTSLGDAFSVCSWVRSYRTNGDPCWFSYAINIDIDNEITLSDFGGFDAVFDDFWYLHTHFHELRGRQIWFHYCTTWSSSSETYRAYLNGKQIGSTTTQSGRRLYAGGSLVLGNDQDSYNGWGMTDSQSFGGDLYNMNVFSEELSGAEVDEMAGDRCSGVEKKHGETRVIKWEDVLTWNRHGNVTDIESGCVIGKSSKHPI